MNKVRSGLFLVFLIVIFTNQSQAQEYIRAAILEEVNKVRKAGCKCGEDYMPPVPPLTWSNNLETAAVRHAADMSDHSVFSHDGTDGSTLGDRISATGFQWHLIGENIAYGYSTVENAVQGWVNSPGHCSNMMEAGFNEMGAAKLGYYWVLDLGANDETAVSLEKPVH
jgi:uncharacterized protein YkwD